ncbi:MAG: undecaprenyl-phosphate glucose phosphotransferase [Muribaculaceae bacterium]|nr:undecaprenyl-phosphate glucose phosphotransferase [Muribaculaceae bacterium]
MPHPERPYNRGHYIRLLLNVGDLCIVNIIFFIALVAFGIANINMEGQGSRVLWLLVNVSYLPMISWTLGRRHAYRAITLDTVVRTSFAEGLTHALVFLSLNAFLHVGLAGRFYIFYYALLFCSLAVFRVLANYMLKAYRRRGFNFTKVAIVGTNATAERLYASMRTDAGFGYRILGFFEDTQETTFCGTDVFSIDKLEAFVVEKQIRQIFFTLSGQSEALARVIKIADDHVVDFYYVPQIPRTLSRKFELHTIGPLPVLSIRHNPLKNVFNRIVKRIFDIVVSGLFLCLYPLIYIPVAIAIKLSSPGPVYFKQERTGYRGKTFMCYKFRTMRMNNNADKMQATQNDPRKTRVGDFLRRTSIDELPQFINVFRGEMSIVGPRPHMLIHTKDYTRLVDMYMVRHSVKPGITGWAQVNGYRGQTDELWKMERRVEHDVWYIEHWSLLLDLKIMVRTVLNAIQGEKNAF